MGRDAQRPPGAEPEGVQPPREPARDDTPAVRQTEGLNAREVADMMGLAYTESLSAFRVRHGFPEPVTTRPNRWRRSDIEAWVARTGRAHVRRLQDELGVPPGDARRIVGLMLEDPDVTDLDTAFEETHELWLAARHPEKAT